MGLKKLVRDVPSTTAELGKALATPNHEEIAADARARRVNIQILPDLPTGPAGHDKTPQAPIPTTRQNGNEKRAGENHDEGKVTAATGAQCTSCQGPNKRAEHGDAATTISRGGFATQVETEGSLTVRISDAARTSTFNLSDCASAIVTVNIRKKAINAPAPTSHITANNKGNKEAKTEGAA
ncbi:hypothetical protein SMACR_06877 [Sordaria macrospora]|uniref:WGS project CABT00000000 data, contig 2.38 n=2 Tax=Sordaria macrospora TaxID=5147 RepID=F7W788_SORMK|nr:uncharacterized protein SMAC_06877 [Sordaria macrospora k-hell]KAA8633656.1 hypothetical protein SMACR_06877 [Sordaria macrospora]KAH7634048.1 hypothetical protein B0T09DRAFT_259098 [Sordaria sp. MPI-SDFR-AT-0083]WPJ59598.1 hypothetical protein SMAC4_06877 [Sordaria macrospora]CCC13379.1 unnamed protein product [Sordaria macrospora k-hell]